MLRAVAVLLVSLGLSVTITPAGAEEFDQFGKTHTWKGATGGYLVIDFAASWCGPCWKTLPEIQQLADTHPDLAVLIVSVDDEVAGRDQLVEGLALHLPVLWDETYAIAEHYRPAAMPATFVLDPEGNVAYQHTGSDKRTWAEFVGFIDQIPKPQSHR